MSWRTLFVVPLLLTAACGDPGENVQADAPSTTATSTTPPARDAQEPGRLDGPPPVVISADGVELTLEPWTYCFGSVCADGFPPDDPPYIGSPEEVTVSFPLEGWGFEASFLPAGETCGRRETATLERRSPTTFSLPPLGARGEQVITLFGRGDGDLFVSFRWTTPVEGPFTPPGATASIVADHDGRMDSYGVELSAHHLAATPAEAAASVTVTATGGASHTIELRRLPNECDDASVRFEAPVEEGVRAAELGEPPFTYDVTLTLDGTVLRGSATWPDDVDPECSPCVPLRFDPPLPARG